jgi:hypothetical protein
MALMAGGFLACQPANNDEPLDIVTTDASVSEAPVSLTLTDGEGGPWRLDVRSTSSAPLIFSRSRGDYRSTSYTPLNDSARLERIGGFDTIVFADAAQDASFTFKPYSGNIRAGSTPFIPFSDGGVALDFGQFELIAVEDVAAVAALDGRLSNWTGEQNPIPLTVNSDRPMLINGERKAGTANFYADGTSNYLYLGDSDVMNGDNLVGVIDPGLPAWIRDDFDKTLGVIFSELETRFGYGLPNRATVLFAYRGDELQGFSNKGSALPGNLLALEVAGTALQQPSDEIADHFHFFFAHEAVHLFQAASGKRLGNQNSSWIHEGQANAIAYRLLVEQDMQSRTAYEVRLAEAFNRCATELEGRALTETLFTGRIGAYDCGEVIAVASDAAMPDHNLFDLWAEMVAVGDDPERYVADDYFAALESLGVEKDVVAQLKDLTQETVSDADATLRQILAAAGLDATLEDGKIIRISMVK